MRVLALLALLLLMLGCITTDKANEERLARLEEQVSTLSAQLSQANEEIERLRAEKTIELNGEVIGKSNDTKIKPSVITSEHIKDGTITAADVNSEEIQLRLKEQCPPGSFITAVFANGSVNCGNVSFEVQTPSLSEVLEKGNDAGGRSIVGVDKLTGNEMIVDRVKGDELCIGDECRESWPSLSVTIEKSDGYSANALTTGQHTLTVVMDDEDWDFCSLTMIYTYSDTNPRCRVFYDTTEEVWKLYANYAVCNAYCFKLSVERS